jgi:hypothetical protein
MRPVTWSTPMIPSQAWYSSSGAEILSGGAGRGGGIYRWSAHGGDLLCAPFQDSNDAKVFAYDPVWNKVYAGVGAAVRQWYGETPVFTPSVDVDF